MALARFFVHKKGGNHAVVRPPFDTATRAAGSNGRVEVTNRMTIGNILVNMPGGVFGNNPLVAPDPPAQHTVAPGATLVLNVHQNAQTGAHDFQVFATETFSLATANSDPEFIIE